MRRLAVEATATVLAARRPHQIATEESPLAVREAVADRFRRGAARFL